MSAVFGDMLFGTSISSASAARSGVDGERHAFREHLRGAAAKCERRAIGFCSSDDTTHAARSARADRERERSRADLDRDQRGFRKRGLVFQAARWRSATRSASKLGAGRPCARRSRKSAW